MIDWKKWKHVTKLDPDKTITPGEIAAIVDSGTDALMVSGTQNITSDKVARLVGMLREYRIPKVLEPAGTNALRDDLDFYSSRPCSTRITCSGPWAATSCGCSIIR